MRAAAFIFATVTTPFRCYQQLRVPALPRGARCQHHTTRRVYALMLVSRQLRVMMLLSLRALPRAIFRHFAFVARYTRAR